jgi:aminopeptidase N
MATAEASRPDPAVKEEVWQRIHGNGYGSLQLAMAAARGFFRRSQRSLVEPFVTRFFEGLPGLFTEWEAEASRAYFRSLFPWHRIEPSTREMVGGVLARGDIGPMLRRLLVEAGDDLDRAIACRRYAEEAAKPAPPASYPSAGRHSSASEGMPRSSSTSPGGALSAVCTVARIRSRLGSQ